jgi:2-polyprenyl-6-methoxyphenol hydroxylase-like FAD-dependent oxidoreductase
MASAQKQPNKQAQVLVVGSGPVGLTTALGLTLRGVCCRIIDKEKLPTDKSKAIVIHARTLEMLEGMGVVEQFLKIGHKVNATNFLHGDQLLVHLKFEDMEGPYRFALMIPQSETERLLTEALAKHGVNIERETELLGLEQSDGDVTARLRKLNGEEEQFSCDWLLGCDGAHSTTRHALNMKFEGVTYEESFATADVHLSWDNSEDELFGWVHEDGVIFFFPLGGHRYRIIADGPLHRTGDPLTIEEMQELVTKRGPANAALSDPVWLTWFTINRRSANNYRKGRVFLIGDAAHIHSPALGQGMNTGMQDALNLVWKLDLVCKELAAPSLLDTYQEERHPVGQDLLKLTDAATKMVTTHNPIAQAIRNKLIPLFAGQAVVQHQAWKTLSMQGVNCRKSSLVGHSENPGMALIDPPAWHDYTHGPAPGDRAPDGDVAYFDGAKWVVTTLFEVLKGNQHHVLFFSGLNRDLDRTADFRTTLNTATAKLREKYSEDFVRLHFILTSTLRLDEYSAEKYLAPKEDKITEGANDHLLELNDPKSELHHRYGALRSCAYIIRPDGYIGYRSMPVNTDALLNSLRKTFSVT